MKTINKTLLTELQHSHNALLLIWRDIDARGITDTSAAQNVKAQIERNSGVISKIQKRMA